MNCRETLLIAIRQGTYAKGAKADAAADHQDLLHTRSPDEELESSTINGAFERPEQPESFEDILKGLAIELWIDDAGRLSIVADGDDSRRVSTSTELRRVGRIGDPTTVCEIHEWKRAFNAIVQECQSAKGEGA